MPIQPTSFRLPSELLDRVAAYAERLEKETGLTVGRSAAVAKLLAIALAVEESDRSKRSTPRAPRR
jgi:hypothetical protein